VNQCGLSILTATGYTGSLLWSNGATTASITVTVPGIYTVTQTVNGCTSVSGSGTAAPLNSTVPVPTVSVSNQCGESVLTASGYTGTLLWSNGSTANAITVTQAGNYSVTQTINDCSSAPAVVTAAPKVVPVLTSSLAVTTNSGVTFS